MSVKIAEEMYTKCLENYPYRKKSAIFVFFVRGVYQNLGTLNFNWYSCVSL